jgi:NADH:ubiquinone oxidoreductase subunit 5 (subunit L)/multisubunit Na+/H+ antiporter MnhA subunit
MLFARAWKNAVVAAAMLSMIVLVGLASYAGFVDQCQDLCVSHEHDPGHLLQQYAYFFAICAGVVLVFSWLLVMFGVHEDSPANTEEECEARDQRLTENDNMQFVFASYIVEMLALGIYGVVSLVRVARQCPDGTVSGSPCHTITWVLTVSSLACGVCVGFLHYINVAAVLRKAREQPEYIRTDGFQNFY